MKLNQRYIATLAILLCIASMMSCSTSVETNAGFEEVPGIAFVKRSTDSLGNPLDPIRFSAGGDLMTLVPGTPSGKLRNLTSDLTLGQGDVSDPEIFPQTETDSFRVVFAMKKNSTDNWHLYEVSVNADGSRATVPEQLTCGMDNETDPAYLPDGRIVFSSDRPGHLDEYERRKSLVLHILDRSRSRLAGQDTCDSGEIVQISFNQSHDRNPTILRDGRILFSRWEHLGGVNKFSIFFMEPDGTDLFVKYGSHSGVNSFLDVRERADGRLTAMMMPLSGTFEGGAIGVLDVAKEADNANTASHQLTGTQVIPSGRQASDFGRYYSAYEIPDSSRRYLTAYSPGKVVSDNMLNPEKPHYGLWMFNMDGTLKPIKTPPIGSNVAFLEAIPLMAIPGDQIPTTKTTKVANRSGLGTTGILGAASVYDSEPNRALSNQVLGVNIPRNGTGQIDFTALTANVNLQVAKEIRVIAAVPSLPGVGREDIGATRFERQKILGYAPIEADGSFRVTIPADTAITLNVVDSKRRSFKVKENWLQVRPGENKTCNGCHSPRRGDPQRLATDAVALNRPPSSLTPPTTTPVIDYVTHIQPIFDTHCISCHSVANPAGVGPEAGLDLSGDLSGAGFTISYEQLLGRMNGSPLVSSGESRRSHLIERLFNEELLSTKPIPASDPVSHGNILGAIEALTVVEWIDLGAQFTNKEVITNQGRVSLSQETFATNVLPILMTRCAVCHIPGGPSDFVLTGDPEGDFGSAISRSNVSNPALSLLLMKAIGNTNGGIDMIDSNTNLPINPSPLSTADADYTSILNWITAAN